MATINDIGVPGQPLSTPPLTEWQKAVRDAIAANQAAISGATVLGVLTPVTGWKDYGSTYGGIEVSRQGRIANISAMLTTTANLSMTAAADYPMATLPAWAYPTRQGTIAAGVWAWASGMAPQFCRITLLNTGVLSIVPPQAQTHTTAGWVAVNMTYRCVA